MNCTLLCDVVHCHLMYTFVTMTEELKQQRDALVTEVQQLKQDHYTEVQQLRSDHQRALESQEERLRQDADKQLKAGACLTEQVSLCGMGVCQD